MMTTCVVESPIITWESATNGAAVRRVLWSRNCAYIIFVLDANSTIHMWDLLRNDAEPMTSDQVIENGKRYVWFGTKIILAKLQICYESLYYINLKKKLSPLMNEWCRT